MDGWMDGWMDGRTDGWMDTTTYPLLYIKIIATTNRHSSTPAPIPIPIYIGTEKKAIKHS